ncbi:MAG: TIGR02147 family protein [Oligoflexales bacterium]
MQHQPRNLDFRNYLENEYQKRAKKNPAYSRRAFAKDLKVSHSFLGRVLKGERKLNLEMAYDFVRIFKWKGIRANGFILLVRYDNAADPVQKEEILQEIIDLGGETEYFEIEPDNYSFFAKWYHGAIVELTKLKDFQSNPKWIAKRLGIDLVSADLAIDRLFRLGLLKKEGDTIVPAHSNRVMKDLPSAALREFHKEMLNRSLKMLEAEHIEDRRVTGSMMAIDAATIEEVNKKIDEFRRELLRFVEQRQATKDSVCHICISFLRLDVP